MAIKRFKPKFIATYYGDSYQTDSGTTIRAGNMEGSTGSWTFIGFPSDVRQEIINSTTYANLKLYMYVTNPATGINLGVHKESFNKASDGLPNYNSALNYSLNTSTPGWVTADITEYQVSGTSYTVKTAIRDGGFLGVVLYGGADKDPFEAYGLTNNSLQFEILVEGTWSDTPPSPTINVPRVGDIVTGNSLNITWQSGNPNRIYKYMVAFDYGAGWDYSPWTSYGATSYTWDLTNVPETSKARIGIKASDGVNDSPYTYVQYFTIDKNQAPSSPSNLSPANGEVFDRTQVKRFSWVHQDDGVQAGFQLRWRQKDTSTWNYIPSSSSFQNTINQYYDFSANTFPASTIEWQVMTKDQQGLTSPWSAIVQANPSAPTNAPTITSPTNGSVIGTGSVTVAWSSLDQQQYEVTLYDSSNNLLQTLTEANNVKSRVITGLQNGKSYTIKVRVYSNSLWSSYSQVSFSVQYTPPSKPVITSIENNNGVATIYYTAGETNLLAPLTGGSPNWSNTVNGSNAEVPPLSVDGDYALTLNNQPYSGKRYKLNYPNAGGKTFRALANFGNFGGRLNISFSPDGNTFTGSDNYTTTAQSIIGTQSYQLTAPTGTNWVRVSYYATQDNSNIVPVTNIELFDTPVITQNLELYRREFGSEDWVKIGTGLQSGQSFFIDYSPASGISYEYKLTAIGDNGTVNDSDPVVNTLSFAHAFLQPADDLTVMIQTKMNDERSESFTQEKGLFTFAGRTYPVVEFGSHETITISLKWQVDSWQEVEDIRALLRRNVNLLYRDSAGRRYWVVPSGDLQIKDLPTQLGFSLSLDLTRIDYVE